MKRLRHWAGIVASCAAVSGCAVDGYSWEEGGPVAEVTIKTTQVADVNSICSKYFPGQTVFACSVMHRDYCEIVVPPNSPGLVAHEAIHCLGYKHPGGQDITASLRNRLREQDGERSAAAGPATTSDLR